MIRRPPGSKCTATLFPSTTLYRSRTHRRSAWHARHRAAPDSVPARPAAPVVGEELRRAGAGGGVRRTARIDQHRGDRDGDRAVERSEEHTSELQSLMRISYAVFCL